MGKIGEQVDDLGVEVDLADGEIITDVVCIAKIVPMQGEDMTVRIAIGSNPSCDWITKLGLIKAANIVADEPIEAVEDDD